MKHVDRAVVVHRSAHAGNAETRDKLTDTNPRKRMTGGKRKRRSSKLLDRQDNDKKEPQRRSQNPNLTGPFPSSPRHDVHRRLHHLAHRRCDAHPWSLSLVLSLRVLFFLVPNPIPLFLTATAIPVDIHLSHPLPLLPLPSQIRQIFETVLDRRRPCDVQRWRREPQHLVRLWRTIKVDGWRACVSTKSTTASTQ
jgi:hypothetical protein